MMGCKSYPEAKKLLITADCGGSNGSRVKLWKTELRKLADETGLEISVSHFPQGTSKWNKIEHRLFSHITMNWRGKPLTSYEVVVNLIAATTTSKGVEVKCLLDTNKYPKGIKIEKKNSLKNWVLYMMIFTENGIIHSNQGMGKLIELLRDKP
jgi:hypothetical protein